MAKLSELIEAVSIATGDGEASVTVIARTLREAGLIATGGRGRNGAIMSAADAASLLIAVGSPGDHTKAATTVAAAGSMRLQPQARMDERHTLACDDIPWKLPVGAGSSLLQVTAALLSKIDSSSCVDPSGPRTEKPKSYLHLTREEGRLEGDLTVVSFSTNITHGWHGWHGTLAARLANHRLIELQFREEPEPSDKEIRGWKESSISLPGPVSLAIMECIHDSGIAAQPVRRPAQ